MPMLADFEFLAQFKDAAEEVYAIGDTREPGYIVDAVADGAKIAREI